VPLWRRVLAQLRDPLILLLLVATALTLATGDLASAVVIVLVITANTAVGVAQEVRAEHALAALRELSAPTARVIRDGEERRRACTARSSQERVWASAKANSTAAARCDVPSAPSTTRPKRPSSAGAVPRITTVGQVAGRRRPD
jgi:hypothetical protein